MNYHKDLNHKNQVFSLNGSGRSGKTTIATRLEENGKGIRFLPYRLRDRFEKNVYRKLARTDEQRNVEIFGIGTFGWMVAEYHLRIKPTLDAGQTVIFDHYLFDYIVEILPELRDIDNFIAFTQETAMPQIKRGNHFYLDIDYKTYEARADRFNDNKKELQTVPESIFYERRERYLKLCEDDGYLVCVDATTPLEDTYTAIANYFPTPKESDRRST